MKNKGIYIGIGVAIVGGVAVWLATRKKSGTTSASASTGTDAAGSSATGSAGVPKNDGNKKAEYLAFAWLGGLQDGEDKQREQGIVMNNMTSGDIDDLYDIVVNVFNKGLTVSAEQQQTWDRITNKYNIRK